MATFPAEGVSFAKATAGTLSVTPRATGTITGRPNPASGSLDLSGPVSYAVEGDAGTCTIAPTAPITLAGSAINLADGSYGVSGWGPTRRSACRASAARPTSPAPGP